MVKSGDKVYVTVGLFKGKRFYRGIASEVLCSPQNTNKIFPGYGNRKALLSLPTKCG